jgi:hypothetical membrane protein
MGFASNYPFLYNSLLIIVGLCFIVLAITFLIYYRNTEYTKSISSFFNMLISFGIALLILAPGAGMVWCGVKNIASR